MNNTTTRLAGTYLAIIMLMSIGFSFVFYFASSNALNRPVPRGSGILRELADNGPGTSISVEGNVLQTFLDSRAEEARRELIARLILLNCLALLAGGGLSYFLARKTLQPIEAAMDAQTQFVSDASHELRTPLTSIQTTNDVALRNKKLSLADAKQIIADNTAEVAKLKQLSDGLLNLASNGSHAQPTVPTSLQAAVSDAINQVIPQAQAKKITIDDAAPNATVLSNQAALTQMLVILLDNAIKYSPEGSTVGITAETKTSSLELQVRDEGIGIRASDLPHIFRRFYRADTARTGNEGYGLGLSIADNLARSHDASLHATSQPGQGSTFSIKLRLAKK